MSAVDRAWLEMDEPRNPMIVAGVLQLSGVKSVASLGRTIAERLLRYARFRERPDDAHSPPLWVPDDEIDLGYHVRVHRLPRRDSDRALQDAVAQELSAELDRGRPLWRVTLFPQSGRRATVLFRGHHAIADGVALLQVLVNCTDAAARKANSVGPKADPRQHTGPIGGLIDRLEGFNHLLEGLREVAVSDLRQPKQIIQQWQEARRTAQAVRRVLTLPQDNPPSLRRPLSGHRRVAWMSDLPLARVKKLAHRLGVKVNDVFIAVLAGALGDVLRASGAGMPDSQNLRVSIPVDLRNGNRDELGNCFGLVLLDLPIAVQDPLVCLRLVSQRMAALKQSPEAKAVLVSLAAAGHLPVSWEKKLVGAVGGKAVAVVSNLPGPRRHLEIGGSRIDHLVFWPPQAGGIGLGISLLSYAGRVSVGVNSDASVLADPQALIDAFGAELREMERLARG